MPHTDHPHSPARASWGARHPITRLVLIVVVVMAVLFVLTFLAAQLYIA